MLWSDIAVNGVPLKEAFPIIFALTYNKVGCVSEYGKWSGSVWSWHIPLRRACFNWELEQWDRFKNSLDSIKIQEYIPDTIGWSLCPDGQFSVKSFRIGLDSGQNEDPSAVNGIWQGFCPSKVEIFVWHLLQGRVAVKKILKRFGLQCMDSLECPMCGEFEEDIDHLFLRCKWAWNLWNSCMNWWGVSSCAADSVRNWWFGWIGLCPKKNSNRSWISMFFAVSWSIWEARNGKVFKKVEASFSKTVDMVRFRVAWWFKNLGKGSKDPITIMLLDIAERCTETYKVKIPKLEKWMPPQSDGLKFNVDGSVRGSSGQAGIGGVLRDSRGKVLCTFSEFIGIKDVITAEIQALASEAWTLQKNAGVRVGHVSVSDTRRTRPDTCPTRQKACPLTFSAVNEGDTGGTRGDHGGTRSGHGQDTAGAILQLFFDKKGSNYEF
ncbi:hypothetical protein Dsin_023817 [Dipteronia sinensis]|uniref:Reverse transcriptase zinc-binding domain-containing protein n=1 Tax=Dipteronia sinensis TaxID=43782 RepID=A0AAE0A4W5_9ROSI|nr:hypothetical protein Dsin_023817 [Dipteronia sinensis]